MYDRRAIYAMRMKPPSFEGSELHRNYYKIQDAINTVEEISTRTGCSVETIKREKRRLFQP